MKLFMEIKSTERKLLEGMQTFFAEKGFTLIMGDLSFERKFDQGIQTFYFLIEEKEGSIYVEPRWSIKLKKILDIYHKVSKKEKKFFKYTSVLGNTLGELIEYTNNGNEIGSGKFMKYLIEDEKDILTLINVIPKRFEEYVLPYFEKNSSVEKVDKLLNKNLTQLSIHSWLYPLRACFGIIAAKLVNNPNFYKILETYEQELLNADPVYKKEFEELKKMLLYQNFFLN